HLEEHDHYDQPDRDPQPVVGNALGHHDRVVAQRVAEADQHGRPQHRADGVQDDEREQAHPGPARDDVDDRVGDRQELGNDHGRPGEHARPAQDVGPSRLAGPRYPRIVKRLLLLAPVGCYLDRLRHRLVVHQDTLQRIAGNSTLAYAMMALVTDEPSAAADPFATADPFVAADPFAAAAASADRLTALAGPHDAAVV